MSESSYINAIMHPHCPLPTPLQLVMVSRSCSACISCCCCCICCVLALGRWLLVRRVQLHLWMQVFEVSGYTQLLLHELVDLQSSCSSWTETAAQ